MQITRSEEQETVKAYAPTHNMWIYAEWRWQT